MLRGSNPDFKFESFGFNGSIASNRGSLNWLSSPDCDLLLDAMAECGITQ